MRYVHSDQQKTNRKHSNSFEKNLALMLNRCFSINPTFFDIYPNINNYWEDLKKGISKTLPIVFNGCASVIEYSARLNLIQKDITRNIQASLLTFKDIPEKLLFVESQYKYFKNEIEHLEPVMKLILDGSRTKVSETVSPQFHVRIPSEIITKYHINEELQFHIEEECTLWFFGMEYAELTNILENLSKIKDQLLILKLAELTRVTSSSQTGTQKQTINENQVIELPENFNLPKLNLVAERLDIRQTALLFDYLKRFKVILNYNTDSLASIIYALTGHSAQNIRTNKGFGIIQGIRRDEPDSKIKQYKSYPNHNLLALKKLLLEIVDDLDIQMKKNFERSRK